MLTGRFTEAASKEVSLPADDPDAMRLVLLTAHLQLAKLPKTLNLDRIAGVAKLCDKYDCATIIGDRVEKWMAAGSFPVKTSESAVSFMWIGWAFHNKAWFVRGLAHLLDEQPPVQIQSLPELPSDCSGQSSHNIILTLDFCNGVRYQPFFTIHQRTTATYNHAHHNSAIH